MKDITVSVDDDVYRAAHGMAAQNQTSVSILVRNYLNAMVIGKAPVLPDQNPEDNRQDREELVRLFREANLVLGCKPTREKTYAR